MAIPFRDRIKEFRRVPAEELLANPRNWRTHPAEQSAAMAAVLREVGIAGAVLGYETPGGIELIDGHLRKDLITGQPIPVLLLDVNEEEAKILLATFDPLSALAGTDPQKQLDLLEDMAADDAVLAALLSQMSQEATDAILENASEENGKPEAEAQPVATEPIPGSQDAYSTFSTPMTIVQEELLRKAVRLAKQKHALERTGDAIFAIVSDWMSRNEVEAA